MDMGYCPFFHPHEPRKAMTTPQRVGTGTTRRANTLNPMKDMGDHTLCFIDLFAVSTSIAERRRRLKVLRAVYALTEKQCRSLRSEEHTSELQSRQYLV